MGFFSLGFATTRFVPSYNVLSPVDYKFIIESVSAFRGPTANITFDNNVEATLSAFSLSDRLSLSYRFVLLWLKSRD